MRGSYEVRDPIHGSIEFDNAEREILNHPCVQRLRHIKQLGFVSLVYPGGSHDRFSHSLGVMHLAGRLFDQIVETTPRFNDVFTETQRAYFRRCVRLAGLLHDVGHTPLSHSSESHLPPLKLLNLPARWFEGALEQRQARHEDFTLWLLNALSEEKKDTISSEMAQDIASLVHFRVVPANKGANFIGKDGWNLHWLLRAMISGECDADRMDYLLRDSHNCGVAYGSYDLNRMIYSMCAYFNEQTKQVNLCLDSNGIFSFEDFLLARYHMFLQVYLHKTVVCFDYFLAQAYTQKEIPFPSFQSPREYLELTDNDIWVWLTQAARKPAHQWSSRLIRRQPAKRLVQLSHLDYEGHDIDALFSKVDKGLTEAKIPHFDVRATQYLTKLGNQGSTPFFVLRPAVDGKERYLPLEKYSRLIEKYNERIYAINIFVWHQDLDRARAVASKVV